MKNFTEWLTSKNLFNFHDAVEQSLDKVEKMLSWVSRIQHSGKNLSDPRSKRFKVTNPLLNKDSSSNNYGQGDLYVPGKGGTFEDYVKDTSNEIYGLLLPFDMKPVISTPHGDGVEFRMVNSVVGNFFHPRNQEYIIELFRNGDYNKLTQRMVAVEKELNGWLEQTSTADNKIAAARGDASGV